MIMASTLWPSPTQSPAGLWIASPGYCCRPSPSSVHQLTHNVGDINSNSSTSKTHLSQMSLQSCKCTHMCIGTAGWHSWSPRVLNHCGFPQGMRTDVSNQVHQKQLHQACSERCYLLTVQIFSQTFCRHLFSLCREVGSLLWSIQHLQQKGHTYQTPNTVLVQCEQSSPICLY